MSQPWIQAVSILLNAINLPVGLTPPRQPTDLKKYLAGSGLEARRVTLVNHVIPSEERMIGGLFETREGDFIPVLGNALDAVLLSATGDILRAVEPSDLDNVQEAWIIEERFASLTSISPFLARYKVGFFELLICALIVNLFALVLPIFSSFVYDKILGNGITDTLWALVIGVILVIGIEFCIRIIRISVAERFAIRSETDIDHSVFRNLLHTSANKMPTIGALLEKYKQVLSFRDFLSSSYLLAFADLPFLILFLVTIAIVSGPLVFVALICGTLMLVSSLIFIGPVLDYDRQSKIASERRFGLMTDVLTAREALIGGALQGELSKRWSQSSMAAVTASSKARYWRGLGSTMGNSISYISFISILVGGVYMVEGHLLTAGGLLAASMLTSRTMGSVSSINTLVIRYREFKIALRELNQIVPSSARVTNKSFGELRGAIRIDKVTCRLQKGQTPVLNDITIGIGAGEMVGIAGAPGAGKTTLLRLIAGVLEPDEGQVLIDNIPLKHLSPNDVSRNIGFKPQDFCLLDGTIEDNVRAGRAPLTADERQDVLVTSGLMQAFHENRLNWTTPVGARGMNISGGQRQLVSLARTFLTRPALILLDEPTNGLDMPLETHLAQQLLAMKGRSTIVVSTHSRNILSLCDRIIVIGQSRVLANGPRDKILT